MDVTDELVSTICSNIYHEAFNETNYMHSYGLALLFDMYLNTIQNDCGNLASFWMSYLVDIMFQLIRASREKEWSLHIAANHTMVP